VYLEGEGFVAYEIVHCHAPLYIPVERVGGEAMFYFHQYNVSSAKIIFISTIKDYCKEYFYGSY
jgi:hypothetical protein